MESTLCWRFHPPYFSPDFRLSLNVKLPLTSKSAIHCGSLKIKPRSISRLVPHNSLSRGDSGGSATIEREDEGEASGSVKPTYVQTPPNRELRTPHSGYSAS